MHTHIKQCPKQPQQPQQQSSVFPGAQPHPSNFGCVLGESWFSADRFRRRVFQVPDLSYFCNKVLAHLCSDWQHEALGSILERESVERLPLH